MSLSSAVALKVGWLIDFLEAERGEENCPRCYPKPAEEDCRLCDGLGFVELGGYQ